MDKLRRAVIKEELVALLGDFKKAVILNQFIYWTERVKDIDKFIEEEKARQINSGLETNLTLQHGWIYKKAEELSHETMLGLSKSNMMRHINEIVSMGYLEKRNNPSYKWDKTLQYRVDLLKLQADLLKLGYTLDGYPLFIRGSKMKPQGINLERQANKTEHHDPEIEQQYQRLQTKITNKNKNNITNKEADASHYLKLFQDILDDRI